MVEGTRLTCIPVRVLSVTGGKGIVSTTSYKFSDLNLKFPPLLSIHLLGLRVPSKFYSDRETSTCVYTYVHVRTHTYVHTQ